MSKCSCTVVQNRYFVLFNRVILINVFVTLSELGIKLMYCVG